MKKNKTTVTGIQKPLPSFLLRVSPLILICIVGAIIYSNSFDCSFHLDDYRYIVDNEDIRDIRDVTTIWNSKFLKRFVTFYTFALNYHVHQDDVFGYHLVNLVIHIGASLFVWWLVLLILSTPVMQKQPIARHRILIALACSLLFLSHPVQTQAVTYIYQRLASLATFFYLASLSFYLKARLTQKRRVSLVCFVVSALLAFLGMFSKETVFTLPFAIILFEFSLVSKNARINIRNRKIVFYMSLLVLFAIILPLLHSPQIDWIFRPKISPRPDDPPLSFWIYLMTQFRVIVTYIRLLFIPVHQNLDYDFPASRSFFEPHTIISFILLVAIFVIAMRLFSKKRVISLGILLFFLTLSVESLIPLREVIFEHRLYLPMFGFSLFFVSSLYSLLGENYVKIMVGILVAVIGCFSFLTYQRNFVWKNEYTLWSNVVAKSPNKARPLNNLGNYLYQQGNYAEAGAVYQKALALNPGYPEIQSNLGTILFLLGKPQEAVRAFQTAISMDSTNARTHYNLGYIQYAQGDIDAAVAEYQTAVTIDPGYTEAYYNLGLAYQTQRRWDEAAVAYQHAISLVPSYIDAYYNLGIMFQRQGRIEEAVRELAQVIALKPSHVNAHVQLAACYRKLGKEAESKIHSDIADSLRNTSE